MSIQLEGKCDGCGWPLPDVPHVCGVGAVTESGRYVYVLTAEVNGPSFDPDEIGNGDYNGITAVHASLDGALAHFDAWLDSAGIDRDTAHCGETRNDTFVGGDPDPDLLDGDVLHWGINKTEVRA